MPVNPFGEDWGKKVIGQLNELDRKAAAQKHANEHTADGIFIEEGLKVWCSNDSVNNIVQWEVVEKSSNRTGYYLIKNGDKMCSQSARTLFVDKQRMLRHRIKMIHEEINDVNDREIFPRLNEVKALREIADDIKGRNDD